MHTFRFNPVFKSWVLLGAPVPRHVTVESAHLLHNGEQGQFIAALNPEQPFILDAPLHRAPKPALYKEEAPLGEYELILYKGDKSVTEWKVGEWENWLHLIQLRLLALQHNPQIHHVTVAFHTAHQDTVGPHYLRVGEVIATSHPIAGAPVLMSPHLMGKLREHERGHVLHDAEDGFLYVPSAPLYEKELWFVPATGSSQFDGSTKAERTHAAEALAVVMPSLLQRWPDVPFVIELHTALTKQEDDRWWLHIYQEARRVPATLDVLPLPEAFTKELAYLLTTQA